jgi:hypothetical protein
MHTIRLNIHDTIYEKLMGLLEILPKDKLEIVEEHNTYPAISLDEAKQKVERAINNIANNEGVNLNTAIDKVMKS